jgi:hypothetical protein
MSIKGKAKDTGPDAKGRFKAGMSAANSQAGEAVAEVEKTPVKAKTGTTKTAVKAKDAATKPAGETQSGVTHTTVSAKKKTTKAAGK